jgi:hypothetical protein
MDDFVVKVPFDTTIVSETTVVAEFTVAITQSSFQSLTVV